MKESSVEYVGLANRAGDAADRVVVRVSATLDDYCVDRRGKVVTHTGTSGTETRLREYWTLGKGGDDRWILLSIEQDPEGEHQLDEPLIADPSGNEVRLADEARVEAGEAARLPDGVSPAEVAPATEGDAVVVLRDLSLQDQRVDPDVVDIAVRRVVDAWESAVDGADGDLARVATPEAMRRLLQGEDASGGTRVVVRGLGVMAVRPLYVDATADPPVVRVAVDLRGIRYVEDRATVVATAGDKVHEARFTERWALALAGTDGGPWRLVSASPSR